MLKVEIDGREVEVPHGSTVMDASNKLGIYVPHFCYHKKLSIAANCRMCLVEVEKARKPLPACATPVTDGMKVKTASGFAAAISVSSAWNSTFGNGSDSSFVTLPPDFSKASLKPLTDSSPAAYFQAIVTTFLCPFFATTSPAA